MARPPSVVAEHARAPDFTARRPRGSPRGALIPIRDINPRLRVPLVNYALIALCVAAFLFQVGLGEEVEGLVAELGFVPARLGDALRLVDPDKQRAVALSVLTSMFLHGGWFHVIGNLLYLRVFGDNVEDRLGHLGYLLFYLGAGAAGTLGHYLADPESSVPMIGASGAIAGALGAYIVLFPRARVLTLFPIFVVFTFIEVPAFVFLGIWAVMQLANGYFSLGAGAGTDSGVAWFAHVGGFAYGAIVGVFVRATSALRRRRR